MNVPFVDLKAQYQSLKPEIDAAIRDVIDNTAFIGGRSVEAFEKAYAQRFGIKHCISCANGTDAIYITLKALGIGPGDEIITVANSWISTSETITQTGARPVFIDIDEYFHINPATIEKKITKRTKAIIPVHLYGQPVAIDVIKGICDAHRLLLIEDCAQSHFATFGDKYTGTFGLAGTFSFYPGKNLGAYGDAGGIVTNDHELADKCRMIANHGRIEKYNHEFEGRNSRLDGLQAAILSIKLKYLDKWIKRRKEIADYYLNHIRPNDELILPYKAGWAEHVWHLFVVRAKRRDLLKEYLQRKGIQCGIHYPISLPRLKAYRYCRQYDDKMIANIFDREVLSLPIGEHLSDSEVRQIAAAVNSFYE